MTSIFWKKEPLVSPSSPPCAQICIGTAGYCFRVRKFIRSFFSLNFSKKDLKLDSLLLHTLGCWTSDQTSCPITFCWGSLLPLWILNSWVNLLLICKGSTFAVLIGKPIWDSFGCRRAWKPGSSWYQSVHLKAKSRNRALFPLKIRECKSSWEVSEKKETLAQYCVPIEHLF